MGEFTQSIKLTLNDQFSAKMVSIAKKTKQFRENTIKLRKSFRNVGDSATKLGQGLATKLTAPLTVLGGAALFQAGNLEKLETSFQSLTGSTDKAKEVMKSLTDFTSKTPFQLEGVAGAAKQLLSFGFSTDELNGNLKTLGDIAAGAGVPLSDMAAILGKVKAKNKAMTEEILQLSDRGIPIIDTLAKKYGATGEEVLEAASKGQISFKVLQGALQDMANEGGVFANQMDKQSQTLFGIFSTLKDNILLALGEIGQSLIDAFDIKGIMTDLIPRIQGAIEWFKSLSPEIKKTAFIVGTLTAAIAPMLVIFGQAAIAISGLMPILTALGSALGVVVGFFTLPAWGTFAIGIAAITTAGAMLVAAWDEVVLVFKAVWEVIKSATMVFSQFIDALFGVDSAKMADDMWGGFIQGTKSLWFGLKEFIGSIIQGFKDDLRKLAEVITGFSDKIKGFAGGAKELGSKAREGLSKIGGGISSGFASAKNFFGFGDDEKSQANQVAQSQQASIQNNNNNNVVVNLAVDKTGTPILQGVDADSRPTINLNTGSIVPVM